MSTDGSFSDHKLCGFLCAVLTVTSPQRDNDPGFNERCEIFGDGAEVGFRCQNGVVFSPVDSVECGSSRLKRMKKIGMVNGSVSVVHQLHALVSRNCMKIDARVLWVEVARVVVLVDVYLPIEVWSGWQFPRFGYVAGAIFRHLRLAFITVLLEILMMKQT